MHKHTGGRHRLRQGLQGDVDADDTGMGEEGLHLERPDASAGAHVQDGAGALRDEWREIVITERAIQSMMLVVEPLILEGIFGQQVGHVGQILALPGRRRPARGRQVRGDGLGEGRAGAAAREEAAQEDLLRAPFFSCLSSYHTDEYAHGAAEHARLAVSSCGSISLPLSQPEERRGRCFPSISGQRVLLSRWHCPLSNMVVRDARQGMKETSLSHCQAGKISPGTLMARSVGPRLERSS
ncbi:hypothetical protein [Thermogemmatispora carboxidivorans]|uniref:hypothetical protein n=1 Tax=Thermogemmatispora carboxidivorans TaxID=1382306 RepID=UPI0012DDDEB0|nr:hypothetical protein [Thermogemmatispora carboxidivorans]